MSGQLYNWAKNCNNSKYPPSFHSKASPENLAKLEMANPFSDVVTFFLLRKSFRYLFG